MPRSLLWDLAFKFLSFYLSLSIVVGGTVSDNKILYIIAQYTSEDLLLCIVCIYSLFIKLEWLAGWYLIWLLL